jgi:hypothetical protein
VGEQPNLLQYVSCHRIRPDKKYPEIALLRTAPGVGPVVGACYVLTLDRPEAMETNRQVGAFLGLRPAQQQFIYGSIPSDHDFVWSRFPANSWACGAR